jgi:hypothetical protein
MNDYLICKCQFKECECGNPIDANDFGIDAECCEWCLPENRFDMVMWREAVGAEWLEQVETHGYEALYTVTRGDREISVFANSEDIAEYIADRWLEREGLV